MDAGTEVQFRPLYGVYSEADPLCYLLKIDGYGILLDCGWTDFLDVSLLEPLKAHINEIDCVLLSHSDTAHLGALPYAVGKLGLDVPIYATSAVMKMGSMYMYDLCWSRREMNLATPFSLDDVDNAFDIFPEKAGGDSSTIGRWRPLKFLQTLRLTDRGQGITITPYNAGRLLGGTVWKITKEDEDIIYAVDYNHKKERHLNGAALEMFNRPALLITDAINALNNPPIRRNKDSEFTDAIVKVLRNNGNVLIPLDTAGRLLEIILVLDTVFNQNKGLSQYKFVLFNDMSYNTLQFAKNHLEWMNESLLRSFDFTRSNAFQSRHLHECHTREMFEGLGRGPKVVLAAMGSLEVGYARELFMSWASNPNNLVAFTDLGQSNTLARHVLEEVAKAPQVQNVKGLHPHATQAQPTRAPTISLTVRQRVQLSPEELASHEEGERRELERKRAEAQELIEASAVAVPNNAADGWTAAAAAAAASANGSAGAKLECTNSATDAVMANVEAGGLSTGAVGASESPLLTPSASGEHNRGRGKARGRWGCLIEGFALPEGAAGPMFPFAEVEREWDEYGEEVFNEDFARDEDAEPEAMDTVTDAHEADSAGPALEMVKEAPTKIVELKAHVVVRCAVLYVEYEGRSDGRSVKTLLSHISPRQLVLVHGTAAATEHLSEHCRRNLPQVSVHGPEALQEIDCSSGCAAYNVKFPEELVNSANFTNVGEGYSVAWLDSMVGSMTKGSRYVPLLPLPADAPPRPHQAALVGSVKLNDFKQKLAAAGIEAEFSTGVLLCGDSVSVRKEASGQLVLEGALSEDYYTIRKLLYDQYYIV
ncbi:hypothetical protein CYMTET_28139 [Cymbomonas tetramitiformis]|uniref:Cleavage and polyadenylation specificity factor subunit 2 n=1 Tax=Cymbomonas tetramitiformis TaxID=36881 RepID=A0AAE0FNT8_9CHLO|nr:hypothetical protein CYMTET_28139 [Cymbomonas tetramitiformis]